VKIEIKMRIDQMKTNKKKSTDDIGIDNIERFTIKEAIDKIKNEAQTNVIILTHMPNLSEEQKLYLMYFWGTLKGVPTSVAFEDTK